MGRLLYSGLLSSLLISASCRVSSAQEAPQRALIVVTSTSSMMGVNTRTGYSLKEAVHAYYTLVQAGFTPDFASPQGGRSPIDPASVDSTDSWTKYYFDDPNLRRALNETIPSSQIDPEQYDIAVFVGGHGALWDFLTDEHLHAIAARVYGKRGIVACISQGAAVLLNTLMSDGTPIYYKIRLTCSSDEEEELAGVQINLPFMLESALRRGGAVYFKSAPFTPNVVPEHRLITGQNTASAIGVAKAVVETWKKLQAGE